jgi:hypothetical protein
MPKKYARIVQILFYVIGLAIKTGVTLNIYVNIAVSVT